MLEPRFAETARPLGLDDLVAFGVQLDVITDTAGEGARGVLDNRQAHEGLAFNRWCCRPDRAERQTFSPVPGPDNSPGCGAAGSVRPRSTATRAQRPLSRPRFGCHRRQFCSLVAR